MKLFAGYDSGGSKTACVLADENGKLLGVGLGGPSNYLYCGKETAKRSVEDSTRSAFAQAGIPFGRLEAAYVASAAIKLQNGARHETFFRTCIDTEAVYCESDIVPIWYGTERENPAVVTIAGTGAITYVCRNDGFVRMSGWGPLLGDEGSGYDLGHRALQTVTRMSDGRETRDEELISEILELYAVEEPYQLIHALNEGDIRSRVALAARPVFQLYEKGNETARRLLEQTADEIALAVLTAVEQDPSGEAIPLICSGSLLKPKEALFAMVKERVLREGSRISDCVSSRVHPAVAAAALALHKKGLIDAAENLLQNEGVVFK